VWLDSILSAEDYLSSVSAKETQVIFGVLLELINCAAVVGIAAMMFPVLRQRSDALAAGYVGFRVVETVVLAVAAIVPLLLVAVSKEYVMAGAGEAAQVQMLGTLAMEARAQLAGLLTPVFFALGGTLLYAYLHQTRLVPRVISVWGLLAVALMLVWNLLTTFGISLEVGIIFGLPIILNEIFLGVWLIARGFETAGLTSEAAR
jgi:hypothetical protein